MPVTLQRFPITTLRPRTVNVFFGKRGSGKSFCMQDFIYHMRHHFQEVLVMSATEDGNHAWGSHVPSTFIHTSFDADVLSRTLARQRRRHTEWQANGSRSRDYPHLLIVAEDLMAEDKKCVNNTDMRYIFMNGRHIGITFCMTVQYLMDLPRALRTNIDVAVVLQDRSVGNIKRLHESWVGTLCSEREFTSIVQRCTRDKGAVVIHVNSESDRLDRVVFWYHAQPHPKFHVGSSGFWAFHYRYGEGAQAPGRSRRRR